MTNKELLDKFAYVNIELDRDERRFIPWRPTSTILKEKGILEKELLNRLEANWYTGTPTDEGTYRVALENDGVIYFNDIYWKYDWEYFDEKYKIIGWQKKGL